LVGAAQTSSPAAAPESGDGSFALGLKAGTLGLGLDGTVAINPKLNLRASANWLDWTYGTSIEGVDYDVSPDFLSALILLDWHPFGNGFRLSGGVSLSRNSVALAAEPSLTLKVGNHEYRVDEIGTGDFDPVAPYVGLGYGNAVGGDGGWSFILDLGVLFQSYEVELTASGPIAEDPIFGPMFQPDLALEEEDIQDFLDRYRIYPVLAVGAAYRF
jgi:hypothetical protein